MFATNRYLTALDIVFSGTETIAKFDYVAFGEWVIKTTATITAIIIAVTSYVYTACQLWWCEHGDAIKVNTIRAVFATADFAGSCYHAGRQFRPVAIQWVNRIVDGAFYTLAR